MCVTIRDKALAYLDQNNLFHAYKKLDFVELLKYMNVLYNVHRATSFNCIDHKNDAQVKFNVYLANNGYRIEDPDISVMTNVDPMIITQMCNDSNVFDHKVIIIVSCDGGYYYTLNELAKCGYFIHTICSKGNTNLSLLKVSDRITYLEDIPGVIPSKS